MSHHCQYLGHVVQPSWISVSSTQMSRLILTEHIRNLYNNSLGGLYFNPHFIDEEAEAQKDRQLGKFSGDCLRPLRALQSVTGHLGKYAVGEEGWGQKTNRVFT